MTVAIVKAPPRINGVDLLGNRDGTPRACVENIRRVLLERIFFDHIIYDELRGRIMVLGETPAHSGYEYDYPRAWDDTDDTLVAAELQAVYDVYVKPAQVPDAVRAVALLNRRHPVREYLEQLQWDQTPRLDSWLAKYLGVEDSPLTRAFAAKCLIGAVARALEPGCKVDTMLILEGPQGILKSSALRALVPEPEFFTDDLGDVGNGKDAAERLRGKWLLEVPELDALGKAEATRVKAFITRQVDHYRPAYGRHAVDFARPCVFFGSTNQEAYLRDETGGRRFWPVKVTKIDVAGIEKARDQLWAEATARYRRDERWWLDSDLAQAATDEQRARFAEDVWHERIVEYIVGRDEVQIPLLLESLSIETPRQDQTAQNRVARTLRHLGWERKQVRVPGGDKRRWVYRPKSPVSPAVTSPPVSNE